MGEGTTKLSPLMMTIISVIAAAGLGVVIGITVDYVEIRNDVHSNREHRIAMSEEYNDRLSRIETRAHDNHLLIRSRMDKIGAKLVEFIQACGCQSSYQFPHPGSVF